MLNPIFHIYLGCRVQSAKNIHIGGSQQFLKLLSQLHPLAALKRERGGAKLVEDPKQRLMDEVKFVCQEISLFI